jgi:hypothetical protein
LERRRLGRRASLSGFLVSHGDRDSGVIDAGWMQIRIVNRKFDDHRAARSTVMIRRRRIIVFARDRRSIGRAAQRRLATPLKDEPRFAKLDRQGKKEQ